MAKPHFISQIYAKAEVCGTEVSTLGVRPDEIKKTSGRDELGVYSGYEKTYSILEGKAELHHAFRKHDGFWTVSVVITSADIITSGFIAPLCLKNVSIANLSDNSSRALRVPFDNDDFVTYRSSPMPCSDVSFEVSAFFEGRSRRGTVVGSVDHDTWKTAVRYDISEDGTVRSLECGCGSVHSLTRDIQTKYGHTSSTHGHVAGTCVSSARIFIGKFSDWRRGLEKFGECNASVKPKRGWSEGVPHGWNSWASMAADVNYKGVVDVSDYFADSLDFEVGVSYIGLDSFWDRMSDVQLRDFVEHCHQNGQKAGIYWCPFSDWIGRGDAFVEGSGERWRYDDIYLRVGGQKTGIESLALDPTHEGTKQRMKYYVDKFKDLGFEYLKLDFINNGTMEADSYYSPMVTTGIQAYNHGMSYLDNLCGKKMFLALSIAPIFPAGYGNSRRISCDTWGAMKEYGPGTTGYMLNSLSFGWWLDRVYDYNDPDHILLFKEDELRYYTEGANRARITTAVMTGLYMLGDNLSRLGDIPGNPEAAERVGKFTSNREINAVCDGTSFYPVEGWTASRTDGPERFFMRNDGDCVYFAVFNFSDAECLDGVIDMDRLGMTGRKHVVCELWTGERKMVRNRSVCYSVPTQDVRLYKICRTK